MSEFFVEIFTEEIPARMQEKGRLDFQAHFEAALKDAGVAYENIISHVTPRRLVLSIKGLPERQKDRQDERKGPKVDAPEKAIEGFLKSTGLTRAECEERETPKGTFLFAMIESKGQETPVLLAQILSTFIDQYTWPKSMNWGQTRRKWVRPILSIVAVFDGTPIPFTLEFDAPVPAPIKAGATTRGHRFMAPQEITVTGYEQYVADLEKAKVVVDQEARRNAIMAQAEKLASAKGLELVPDEGLIREVTGLVEQPVVMMGSIDERFMQLPREVLITTMRVHQRYFALQNKSGELVPHYLVVANIPGSDGGATVIDGNQRVLNARLEDAAFFWETDLKTPLREGNGPLKDQVFHAKLGSMWDKVVRVQSLVKDCLGPMLVDGADQAHLDRAAELCKADLATGMVYEFPEVQGTMGHYYALKQGENALVAGAIRDHYAPQGPSDPCPKHPVSVALALADKIDSLVGFYAIGLHPTGSKDPLALRRAALGVIRLILENDLSVSLKEIIERAFATYFAFLPATLTDGFLAQHDTVAALLQFIGDRLKVYLKGTGARYDLVNAAMGSEWLGDVTYTVRLSRALSELIEQSGGADLMTAYRRAINIVEIEEKKAKTAFSPECDTEAFQQDEESFLYSSLQKVRESVRQNLDSEMPNLSTAMRDLAELRPAIDKFFDQVTVNAEEESLRQNRLSLLSYIRATFGEVADFSAIEG